MTVKNVFTKNCWEMKNSGIFKTNSFKKIFLAGRTPEKNMGWDFHGIFKKNMKVSTSRTSDGIILKLKWFKGSFLESFKRILLHINNKSIIISGYVIV